MIKFLKKKYTWTLTLSIILILSNAYVLLDTFVMPKSYAKIEAKSKDLIISENSNQEATNNIKSIYEYANENTNEKTNDEGLEQIEINSNSSTQDKKTNELIDNMDNSTQPIIDSNSYKDENISITIETVNENGVTFYVADVILSDISYLKTAFANNTFGKNITDTTSSIAKENNAIFAVNGDYYGFRDTGVIIRNGILYRNTPRKAPDNKALIINDSGNLEIVMENQFDENNMTDILQSFSFGPVLVENGTVVNADTNVSSRDNPRTAIGLIDSLHYIFIVVDGRTQTSEGMSLEELSEEFVKRGAKVAYNLDGGGSSSMWFMGELINNPTDGRHQGERSISDIIYIGK